MSIENIGEYEIEYTAVPLNDVAGWAAHVAVYGPSANPMHRNTLFPEQRVLADSVFASRAQAESEARKAALALLT
jgi:hypothetical protein